MLGRSGVRPGLGYGLRLAPNPQGSKNLQAFLIMGATSSTQEEEVVVEEKKTEKEEIEEKAKEQRIVAGYGGCVSTKYNNKQKEAVVGYQVTFGEGQKRLPSRFFNVDQFGSQAKAKEAAEQYRRQRSDALGRTVFHHLCFTKVFEPLRQQIVAGCYDGDGCIRVTSDGKRIEVIFSQSGPSMDVPPTIIQLFRETYGGTAYLNKNPELHHRPAWALKIDNRAAQILLEHISAHGIVKKPQADLVLPTVRKMIPLRHTPKDERVTPELAKALKVMKKQYATVHIDPNRLTVPHMAGLFEAEGCVAVYEASGLSVQIAQKQCVPLLYAIRDRLQAGSVDVDYGYITLYSSAAFAFLKSIAPFLVGKKAQVHLVLANEHLLTRAVLKEKQAKEREVFIKTLSDMKHEGAIDDADELEFTIAVYCYP